jgi:hypothetical protein
MDTRISEEDSIGISTSRQYTCEIDNQCGLLSRPETSLTAVNPSELKTDQFHAYEIVLNWQQSPYVYTSKFQHISIITFPYLTYISFRIKSVTCTIDQLNIIF